MRAVGGLGVYLSILMVLLGAKAHLRREENRGKKMETDMIRDQPWLVENHAYVVDHDPMIRPKSLH